MYSYIYRFYKEITKPPFTLKLIGDNKIYNQKEILSIIKRLVVYFDSIGIKRGSRVAMISKNKPHFLFTLYALLYLRAIPVSIDYYHDSAVIDKLIKSEPFVISDRKIKNYDSKVIYFSCLPRKINNVNGKKFSKIIRNLSEKVKKDNPFIVLCSSGTISEPKKVILSESNMAWADKEYYRLYNFKKNNSIAFIVPTHYSLGILACGLIPFFHKRTILICDGKKVNKCLKKISKHKINILPATPTIFNLMNKCNLDKYNFSSLKVCDSGGQILPVSVIKKFASYSGVFITEGYGLTETSSLTHFLVPDHHEKLRLGSIGKPCIEVKCKIIDENGNKVGSFVPGELLVKGPQNMLGYDDERKNREIFTKDNWLKTGDIVYKDGDEFYYLVSRKIDLLENKYIYAKQLREIEEILYSLDVIKEGTALLTKNRKVVVFIEPNNKDYSYEEVKKITLEKLSGIPLKIEIKLVDSIPRTSTHKVRRNILRQFY